MAPANDNVLAPHWERLARWACGAIIALLCIGYQDQKSTIERLDERVQFLMLDKVSKDDMRELEQRIMERIEAGNADILARLELYFGKINREK